MIMNLGQNALAIIEELVVIDTMSPENIKPSTLRVFTPPLTLVPLGETISLCGVAAYPCLICPVTIIS